MLKHLSHLMQTVGKYQLTPSAQMNSSGSFTASLSIRSGQGCHSHDRIFRFLPSFGTAKAATHYALAQGKLFVLQPQLPA